MKKISEEQIKHVLQVVYSTNIPVSMYDNLSTFFSKLEDVETPKTKKDD